MKIEKCSSGIYTSEHIRNNRCEGKHHKQGKQKLLKGHQRIHLEAKDICLIKILYPTENKQQR